MWEVTRTNMKWDELAPKLTEGFLIDAAKELEEGEKAAITKLTAHWSQIFCGYHYEYDSSAIKDSFVISVFDDVSVVEIDGEAVNLTAKSYSDDFYKFYYFAEKHLIFLYGNNPRNWLSENEIICDSALHYQLYH